MADLPLDATVGRAAYEAYRHHARKVREVVLRPWDDLTSLEQGSWDAAGVAAWEWKEGGYASWLT